MAQKFKKLKKFLHKKGGLVAVITTASLCFIALLSMTIGYVYSDLGGDWSRLGELFGADWMVAIYIILGVLVLSLIYLLVLLHRKEEKY